MVLRADPDGHKDDVGIDFPSFVRGYDYPAGLFFEGGHRGAEHAHHALFFEVLPDNCCHLVIEDIHHLIEHFHDKDFAAPS